MIKQSTLLGMLLLAFSSFSNAAVTISTDKNDFTLNEILFPHTALTRNDIVSEDGSLTLVTQSGAHRYSDSTRSILDGAEYGLNDNEHFDAIFSEVQTVFAFKYEDRSVVSEFTLNFINGATNVGSASFTPSLFQTEQFIAFTSDSAFDKVTVRERTSSNSNEYFQFYTVTSAVPEPSTLALFGLGLGLLGFVSRRKLSQA